jgi:drug/metabolite transporter (DMT)-like permease
MNTSLSHINHYHAVPYILFSVQLRAFFGCSAVICQFYALTYIAIGDVTVIAFSTPVFVTILAYFLLNEKLGYVSMLATFMTTIGIIVISKPPIFTGDESLSIETIVSPNGPKSHGTRYRFMLC